MSVGPRQSTSRVNCPPCFMCALKRPLGKCAAQARVDAADLDASRSEDQVSHLLYLSSVLVLYSVQSIAGRLLSP